MSNSEIKGPETQYGMWRLVWPAVAIMTTMMVTAGIGGSPGGPKIIGFDKVAHFFIFGLIGTLIFRFLRIGFLDHKRWIFALLGVILFGLLDESLQFINPNRTFDPYDWLADLTGSLLAIFLYRGWAWYRNALEFPLFGRLANER